MRNKWGDVKVSRAWQLGRETSLGQWAEMPDTHCAVFLISPTPSLASDQTCLVGTLLSSPPTPRQALSCTPLLCLRLGFAKATYIPEVSIIFWKARLPPTAYLRLDRKGAHAAPLHTAGAAGQDTCIPLPLLPRTTDSTALRTPKESPAPSFTDACGPANL